MKKIYSFRTSFSLAFVCVAFALFSQAKFTVTTTNTFDPETLNITLNDTVEWVWGGGTPHTTTSDATTGPDVWTSDLSASNPSFKFVINQVGDHPYHCFIHGGVGYGQTGLIVVSPTGIDEMKAKNGSMAFPNPFTESTYIAIKGKQYDKAEVYNNEGKLIKTIPPVSVGPNTVFEVNLSDYPSGMFVYKIFKDGQGVETKSILKNQ